MDRRIHLKIKIKSLAAEAGIIRKEAEKLKGMARHSLNEHRKGIVRHEARHALLAYGLLRGRPYEAVEKKCHEPPDWKKVSNDARRFGASETDVAAWVALAKKHIQEQK